MEAKGFINNKDEVKNNCEIMLRKEKKRNKLPLTTLMKHEPFENKITETVSQVNRILN